MKTKSFYNPSLGGMATQSGKAYPACLRLGATRLTLAIFILLGSMFGTSLSYLALAALRAAKSMDDETVPVAVNNPLSPPLGNGWEYAFAAARECSSERPPRFPV
jgi:hypothetical protein